MMRNDNNNEKKKYKSQVCIVLKQFYFSLWQTIYRNRSFVKRFSKKHNLKHRTIYLLVTVTSTTINKNNNTNKNKIVRKLKKLHSLFFFINKKKYFLVDCDESKKI